QKRVDVGVHDVGETRKNTHNSVLIFSVIGPGPAEWIIQFPCQLFMPLIIKEMINFTAAVKWVRVVKYTNQWRISSWRNTKIIFLAKQTALSMCWSRFRGWHRSINRC